jgi:hypothetical protein
MDIGSKPNNRLFITQSILPSSFLFPFLDS